MRTRWNPMVLRRDAWAPFNCTVRTKKWRKRLMNLFCRSRDDTIFRSSSFFLLFGCSCEWNERAISRMVDGYSCWIIKRLCYNIETSSSYIETSSSYIETSSTFLWHSTSSASSSDFICTKSVMPKSLLNTNVAIVF